MENKIVKEKAADRRNRLAKELEKAYNENGNYRKVINEIESYGDSFSGRLFIKARGVVHWALGDAAVDVEGDLPKTPKGWELHLQYVKVERCG